MGKKTLREIVEELERQKKNRYDITVPSEQLKVVADVGTNTIKISVPQLDEKQSAKLHGITEWTHRQIAEKCKIPKTYYDRMREENKHNLLAYNINSWFPDKEKRLVRVLDNNVRALLSSTYRCIDNYDILYNAMQEFEKIKNDKKIDIDIQRADITDRHLYIKAVSPQLVDEITGQKAKETFKPRDYTFTDKPEFVHGGIIIRNSEVGDGAVVIQPFISVLRCTNGLISDRTLRRIHRGKDLGVGIIEQSDIEKSDETKILEDKALWSRINDLIHRTFNSEIFHKWVDEINEVATIEIPKPTLAVDNIIKHYGLPEKKKDDLLNQFSKEGNTQWGLSMAVTRVAQDLKDYEQQIEWEKVGANILDKKTTEIILKEEEEE